MFVAKEELNTRIEDKCRDVTGCTRSVDYHGQVYLIILGVYVNVYRDLRQNCNDDLRLR